jgi:hypothetical protein
MRACDSSFEMPDNTTFLGSRPFCTSIVSSRFRFAKRLMEEDADSECDGGLRTPFTDAITTLAVRAV